MHSFLIWVRAVCFSTVVLVEIISLDIVILV